MLFSLLVKGFHADGFGWAKTPIKRLQVGRLTFKGRFPYVINTH